MEEQRDDATNWLREGVVYQVYVRSFKDGNNDGIGDLWGLIEKLDYLGGTKTSLGVDALWLNPIYLSPMKDAGYDITDHMAIDPVYGGMEAFNRLLDEVHKRGMKIMMDFVPNHTSSEHPWFVESRSSRGNPKRDWYVWRNPKPDGSPPNNWLSKLGDSAWTYDNTTGQYYLHKYLSEQPDLNWRNEDVRRAMGEIMRFWLDKGVDGFRTDAVNQLLEDPNFEDDPPNPNYRAGKDDPYDALLHVQSRNYPDTFLTIDYFCHILSGYKDRYMVSEAHVGIEDLLKFYHACPDNHVVPFNFNLIGLPWSATSYRTFIDRFERVLQGKHWPNYVLGNHDLSRLATRLGEKRARLAAMLLFTLRGTPYVYYGEEIGMQDGAIPEGRVADPWEKHTPGFNMGRDPARTPMQWTGGTQAGFAGAHTEPWLPVAAHHDIYNVHEENSDPHSMLNLYRDLIRIRKQSRALVGGAYRSIDVGEVDVFCFVRELADEVVYIAINFSDAAKEIRLGDGTGTLLATQHGAGSAVIDCARVTLPSCGGIIVKRTEPLR